MARGRGVVVLGAIPLGPNPASSGVPVGLLPATSVCDHLGFPLLSPHETAGPLSPFQPWDSVTLGPWRPKFSGLAACLGPWEPAWAGPWGRWAKPSGGLAFLAAWALALAWQPSALGSVEVVEAAEGCFCRGFLQTYFHAGTRPLPILSPKTVFGFSLRLVPSLCQWPLPEGGGVAVRVHGQRG